jgi:hypothetical protein
MAKGDLINLKPHFKKEDGDKLPCDGEAGDLYVFTKLDKEGDPDASAFGVASLWFCTKGTQGGRDKAVWRRVQFDGFQTCATPPPPPPANPPELKEG